MIWKWSLRIQIPTYLFSTKERERERKSRFIFILFPPHSNIFHLFHPQCIDPREKFSFKSIAFLPNNLPARQTLFTDTFYSPLTIRAKRNQPPWKPTSTITTTVVTKMRLWPSAIEAEEKSFNCYSRDAAERY